MSMFGTPDTLPPADELSTNRIATLLCHRLLPGATSTTRFPHGTYRLPESWLIAAHKAARRHRPQDDGKIHMRYTKYTEEEILGSLSVKLQFDLETIKQAAADGNDQVVLTAVYSGLRALTIQDTTDSAPWPGHG